MTEEEIELIQKELKDNETRMFHVCFQSGTEFMIRVLYITTEDWWIEDSLLTADQFLENFAGQ